MSEHSSTRGLATRLIHPWEMATVGAGMAYVAAVIVAREHFPAAHGVWLVLTQLFTAGMALIFPAIDGHAEAYRNILSDNRIEELRAIYAANRLCALAVVAAAVRRVVRHAAEIEWAVWRRYQFQAKWIFLVALAGLVAAPVALAGLVVGFSDQNFFEFALGFNWVDRDFYYFLDLLWFVLIAWQFLFFFPTVAYFTASVGYGHWIDRHRSSGRR